MSQAIWRKKSDYAISAGTGFALKPGKKGLSDFQNLKPSGRKIFVGKVWLDVLKQSLASSVLDPMTFVSSELWHN